MSSRNVLSNSWRLASIGAIAILFLPLIAQLFSNLGVENPLGYAEALADTTDPSVTISKPTEGSYLPTGPISVSGIAFDNTGGSGVQKVELKVDGGLYKLATPKSANDWSTWSISSGITSTGTHTLKARATDLAGNQDWDTILITVYSASSDTVGPTLAITEPATDSNFPPGPVTIKGTAVDSSSGVKEIQVKIDGDSSTYKLATPKSANDWSSWSFTTSISNAGAHSLTARATDHAGNNEWYTITVIIANSVPGKDIFGIKEIYPTKSEGREWFINMNNPSSDGQFDPRATISRNSDGSWRALEGQYHASQIRMYVYSPSGYAKWRDVEVTGYLRVVSGTGDRLQWFTRSGENDNDVPCEGMSYRGRVHVDGDTSLVKKLWHSPTGGYSHPLEKHDTSDSIKGRWIGWKLVVFNKVINGKTAVHVETYLDDKNDDNWVKVQQYDDTGSWPISDTNEDYYTSLCSRSANYVITGAGPITAFRSDNLVWDFKNLSVREITPS